MNGQMQVMRDEIAEKLDEMADLCEYWKKNRDKGRMPNGVRAALLIVAGECKLLQEQERLRMHAEISSQMQAAVDWK